MKTAFIFLAILAVKINSQWEPDVRLTNDPAISNTNTGSSITATGQNVHIAWSDLQFGHANIFYQKSTNGGANWLSPQRITSDTNSAINAVIRYAINDNVIITTAYRYNSPDHYTMTSFRSTNSGNNWSAPNFFSSSPGSCIDNDFKFGFSYRGHEVYDDDRYVDYEIYFNETTDGGLTWSSENRLTNSAGNSLSPKIEVSSNEQLNLVWYDNRGGNYDIYYKSSTDNGATWTADFNLTNNPSTQTYPSITSTNQVTQDFSTVNVIHVVWEDFRSPSGIYYKRSTDNGATWSAAALLTNASFSSQRPTILGAGPNLHLIWQDSRDGNFEIYYKRSTDAGITWDPDLRLTNAAGNSFQASIAVEGTAIHLLWTDNRDGNYEVYYKRNLTGNPVIGIHPISSEIPEKFFLWQNYPNPFNPATKLKFDIPSLIRRGAGVVLLKVFDILGREVATLVNEQLNPGTYEVEWDASNYTSGVYYYRLSANGFVDSKKMMLIK